MNSPHRTISKGSAFQVQSPLHSARKPQTADQSSKDVTKLQEAPEVKVVPRSTPTPQQQQQHTVINENKENSTSTPIYTSRPSTSQSGSGRPQSRLGPRPQSAACSKKPLVNLGSL